MTELEFRTRLFASSVMAGLDYDIGYQHGLRCCFYGKTFSPPKGQDRWLRLSGELGDGYRDGLAGLPPRQIQAGEAFGIDHILV